MAYFNQYYNNQYMANTDIPKPYQVPGYYNTNTPNLNSNVNIPQYNQPNMEGSLQTPGLSMQGQGGTENTGANASNVAGQVGGYVNTAMNAYQQGQAGTVDLDIDKAAVVKGAGQGFAQGGWIGAIIGGAAGGYGTFKKANDNLKKLNYQQTGYTTDSEGNVMYSGQDTANSMQNEQKLTSGLRSLDDQGFRGALHNALDPATSSFSRLFGTRKKYERAQRRLRTARDRANEQFNAAYGRMDQARLARESYQRRQDSSNRLYNLYNR
jgi:hypothetical protein